MSGWLRTLLLAGLAVVAIVEVGQLLVVAAAFIAWRTLARWRPFAMVRTPALYAIGSVAACWTIGRTVALLA